MFNSYYCNDEKKARPIEELTEAFAKSGNEGLNAACSEELHFTADEWNAMSEKEQQEVLMNYRIAYLGETMVNWCPQLGTVLANDEVVDGVSERGGFPVVQKKMRQWCLRVSAYAQRLLDGLDTIDWTESLKETQKNWIGRSEGAEIQFKVKDSDLEFTIFTTRADTMFGVTFMVLAPESELVAQVTTPEQKADVDATWSVPRNVPNANVSPTAASPAYSPEAMPSIPLRAKQCPSGLATTYWQDTEQAPSWPYLHTTAATTLLPSTSTCLSFRWWKAAM